MTAHIDDTRRRIDDATDHRRQMHAQKQVIGALLLCRDGADRFHALRSTHDLKAEDFDGDAAIVWDCMAKIADSHGAVPFDTVTVTMQCHDKLTDRAFAERCADAAVTSHNLTGYASKVLMESRRRKTIATLLDAARALSEADDFTLPDALRSACSSVEEVATVPADSHQMSYQDAARIVTSRNYAVRDDRILSTGIPPIDEMLGGGYRPGRVYSWMGRPGHGKSTAGMMSVKPARWGQIAGGDRVLIQSLEMSAPDLAARFLADELEIAGGKFERHKGLDQSDIDRIVGVIDDETGSVIEIDAQPGVSASQIVANARRFRAKHGRLDLLIIDFLQLLGDMAHPRGPQAGLDGAMRTFQEAARRLDCAIVIMVQCNRKCEERADKFPMPSDAEWCGKIEQLSWTVLGVMLPHKYDRNADPGAAKMGITKNRGGVTGFTDLRFAGKHYRFFEELTEADLRAGQSGGPAGDRARLWAVVPLIP